MLTPIDLLKIFFIFFIELKKWNITDNERVALIYYVAFKLSYPGVCPLHSITLRLPRAKIFLLISSFSPFIITGDKIPNLQRNHIFHFEF